MWEPQVALLAVWLYGAAAIIAKAMASANPNRNFTYKFGTGLGEAIGLTIVLGAALLVVSAIVYLGFQRGSGVRFTQTIFSWTVVGVMAILGLLFIFIFPLAP